MKARFGRNIFCQECGKDDMIFNKWYDQFRYYYICGRCRIKVKEVDKKEKEASP
jgi:hypothetical protein